MKKFIKSLLSFFILVVIVAILLEISLRIYESIKSDFGKTEIDESIFVKVPFLGFRLRPNIEFSKNPEIFKFFLTPFDTNSFGFRKGAQYTLEKQKNIYRIICIGASTTFGHGSSSDKTTYPSFLEEKLNKTIGDRKFEVLNVAIPGFNILQNLILLNAELLEFNPDMIIIYSGWNDLSNFFHLDDADPIYEGLFVGDSRFAQYVREPKNKYFSDSRLAILRRLGRWQYKIEKKKHKIRNGYKQELDIETRRQKMAKSVSDYIENEYYLNRVLNIYKNCLESIVLLAQKRGIKVVLLTLPPMLKQNSPETYFEIFKQKFVDSVPFIKKDDLYTQMRFSLQEKINSIIKDITK